MQYLVNKVIRLKSDIILKNPIKKILIYFSSISDSSNAIFLVSLVILVFISSNLFKVVIVNKNIVTSPKYRYSNVAFSTPTKRAISLTYFEPKRLKKPSNEPINNNSFANILAKGLIKP